jgi:hypothetical protein
MTSIPTITKFADHSPAPNASDPRHIYRLDPSLEVDAAWARIATADGIYPMSVADVIRAGKDPALTVDAPASWGFPPDKPKMMGIEAFHLLHCLNAVRKSLITTYDYYWGVQYGFTPPAVFARHLNHCVDVLRQHLMCHADLEPFTFNWRVGQTKPYADFAVKKTCVDFDYLLEWSETNKDPLHEERVSPPLFLSGFFRVHDCCRAWCSRNNAHPIQLARTITDSLHSGKLWKSQKEFCSKKRRRACQKSRMIQYGVRMETFHWLILPASKVGNTVSVLDRSLGI